jgi:hypothetical protein
MQTNLGAQIKSLLLLASMRPGYSNWQNFQLEKHFEPFACLQIAASSREL